MFDAVRNNKRLVQVFLALIILPFAFWGVDSYVRGGGAGSELAKVGDSRITQNDFQIALREQQDQLRQALGPNFNPSMLESPAVRRSILDQLINQRILLIEAANRHIVVSDQALRDFIVAAPPFQADGKFSMDRYQAFVASQGKTQQGFEHDLRQDLLLRQLVGAVSESGVVSHAVLTRIQTGMAEKRTVQELRYTPEAHASSAKVAEGDVQKYYDENRKEFEDPEQVRAEFVVLTLDALVARVKVAEAEVRARYESQKDRFQGQEERRASHILLQAERGNADARTRAKARAAELLVQIKAKPADFGRLAKQNSQDPGSASQDGDLGYFARGMMVKPFEDAVFSMKEKEISDVVESDFGFHVIQVTGIRAAKGRSFDEVSSEIEAELRQQSVQKLYAEAAEAFTNMVYEQSDSLKPVVERFGVPIQQTNWMIKGAPLMPGGPFANPKLSAAIFSADAIKNKRNTEAVETQASTLVSARVVEHKPAALRPFDMVKASIREKLQRKSASELAMKAGEAKLAELRQGKDSDNAWGKPVTFSRVNPQGMPPEAMNAISRIPSAALPGFGGAVLAGGGYSIFKLTALDSSATLEPQVARALDTEVRNAVAQEDMRAYLAMLRTRHAVEVNNAALEAK